MLLKYSVIFFATLAVSECFADCDLIEFSPPSMYSSGNTAGMVRAVDIDNDQDLDVVSVNRHTQDIYVFRNDGDRVLVLVQTLEVGDPNVIHVPRAVYASDVNRDGWLDVMTANEDSDTISVFLNNGEGLFQSPTTFLVGNRPTFIIVEDLDNDLWPDLIALHRGVAMPVWVYRNQGLDESGQWAGFTFLEDYPSDVQSRAMRLGDVSEDGLDDIVVVNRDASSLTILLGRPDAGFVHHGNIEIGMLPRDVSMGDLDGDGDLDLAVVDYSTGEVFVFSNRGRDNFQWQGFDDPVVVFTMGNLFHAVDIADIDGDARPDIVGAQLGQGGGVWVLLNEGNLEFSPCREFVGSSSTAFVTCRDLDGDGRPEIVTSAALGSGSISILWNNDPQKATGNGDITGDGVVDGADLAMLLSAWGAVKSHPADFTGDGFVNGADLAFLLSQWGLVEP